MLHSMVEEEPRKSTSPAPEPRKSTSAAPEPRRSTSAAPEVYLASWEMFGFLGTTVREAPFLVQPQIRKSAQVTKSRMFLIRTKPPKHEPTISGVKCFLVCFFQRQLVMEELGPEKW